MALDPKKKIEEEFDPAVDEEIVPVEPAKPAAGSPFEERMVKAIEMLAAKQDQGPIQQVPLPRAQLKTPWNPSGKRIGRLKFSRDTWMNGNKLRDILHSEKEIALFNQIKAGRYLNGQVVVTEKFSTEGRDEVEIRVANKTTSDKIAQAMFAPDVETMLGKMLAEYATQQTT